MYVKNRKFSILHCPFDKAKVYYTGGIHRTYEIKRIKCMKFLFTYSKYFIDKTARAINAVDESDC